MKVTGQPQATVALSQGKESVVPTEEEPGWAPEPVWMFWRREKYLVPSGIRTPDRPAHRLASKISPFVRRQKFIRTHDVRVYLKTCVSRSCPKQQAYMTAGH